MRYLHAANEHYRVLVLPVQSHLLASYRLGDHGLGGGISAMPSLHVSTALVSALAVSRVSRSAGAWLYAFMGVIMLGSIHLGYHYAVDSVVAVSMTLVLWRIAGVLARMVIQRGDALQPARVPALGADIALA